MRLDRAAGHWWLICLLLPVEVLAQGAGARAWSVEPRVSLSETYTDNVSQTSGKTTHELVTQFSPGIRLDANSSRLKASLDYQRTEILYANDSGPSRSQNALSAFGRFEAIESQGFVDFSGSIARTSESALQPKRPNYSADNAGATETTAFRVSPSLVGRLGSAASYEMRYSNSVAHAKGAGGNSSDEQWAVSLSGGSPLAFLTWGASATTQRTENQNHLGNESSAFNGRLIFRADEQVSAWFSAGRESNDYASSEQEAFTNRGAGVDWAPGPRTRIAASREKRFFGNSNSFSISHRMAHGALRMSRSQSVSSSPEQLATANFGTFYDAYYSLYESLVPDPVQRAAFVRALLQAQGIPPDTAVLGRFAVQRVTIQKRTDVSYGISGVRNSVTLTGSRTDSRALQSTSLGDDFDTNDSIRQMAASAAWALRLTPASSINLTLTRARTEGSGNSTQASSSTTSRSIQAGYQTALGHATALDLSLRRTDAEDGSGGYIEKVASATLTYRF